MSVWFITGASRGLGKALVSAVLDAGDTVVAAVRDSTALPEYIDDPRVLTVGMDVTDRGQVDAAISDGADRFGRIDVLVNNAGYGLLGPIEETSEDEARSLFDVNFFGLFHVTQAVLPLMRAARHGHVVNISSVGGFTALPGSGMYAATKFAVEAISEAMQAELTHTGVRVHIIEPGAFRTNFLDARSIRTTAAAPLPDYAATVHDGQPDFLAANGRQDGDPRCAATAIVAAVTADEPPFRLQLGADCVERVEQKLSFVWSELDKWRQLSMSTSYDAAEA